MAAKARAKAPKSRKERKGARSKKTARAPEIWIGEKVRGLRKAKGLSIQKLADLSGVSPAGVYKIETNGMMPTITTLVKLARALEQRVSFFVEEEEEVPEVRLIRKGERTLMSSGQEGRTEAVVERYNKGKLECFHRTLEPGSRCRNPMYHHEQEQCIYCLKGELRVTRAGEKFLLKEGDALHIVRNKRIQFENQGRSTAQFLLMNAARSSN